MGYLFEVGVEHPHDDRQVDQCQNDDQANSGIQQARVTEQQVNRDQYTHWWEHLGRQHPHQYIFGLLTRNKGHRPCSGYGNKQTQQR